VDDDPLDPVRELEGDDIARPYSEFEQAEGAPVDLSLQLGMTDLVARVERDLVRSQGGHFVDAVRDGAVSPVALARVRVDLLWGEDGQEPDESSRHPLCDANSDAVIAAVPDVGRARGPCMVVHSAAVEGPLT